MAAQRSSRMGSSHTTNRRWQIWNLIHFFKFKSNDFHHPAGLWLKGGKKWRGKGCYKEETKAEKESEGQDSAAQ